MICLTGRSDIGFSFLPRGNTSLGRVPGDRDNLSLHELDVERDGHLVANENATGLKRGVPGQAEVFTVDLRRRRYRNSGVAPGILCRRGWAFNGKEYLACDAPNGQVALYGQFSVLDKADARGLQGQRWELLHV